jgi:hypothetical protein
MPWNSAKTNPGISFDFKLANAFGSVSPEKTAFAPLPINWLLGLLENTKEYPNKNHYPHNIVSIHFSLFLKPAEMHLVPG